MKASLTDLVKSWQKNAEEFRGQSPHSPQSTLHITEHISRCSQNPVMDREAFPAELDMLFFPHIINSVFSSWTQMGSSAQRTITLIRGLSMTSWEMSEVS